MEHVGADRYRVASDVVQMFDRVYGGQLLAQALVGAGTTVEGKAAHSLHAAFVQGRDAGAAHRGLRETCPGRPHDGHP